MTDEPSPPAIGPRLHCLGGNPLPDVLLEQWRQFEALPDAARKSIWRLLTPLLLSGPGEEVTKVSLSFCKEFKTAPQHLEAAAGACYFLVTQAAKYALPEAEFEKDLVAISAESRPGVGPLMSEFSESCDFLRTRILEGSLLDHGKVFTGLDWRLDTVGASDRGLLIDTPVALLTLRHQQGYDEHSERGKTSLYFTREAVGELKRVCEQLEQMFSSAETIRDR